MQFYLFRIAVSKVAAVSKKISLFKNLGNGKTSTLPIPLMNIINGGVHANNSLRIQEFMIRPDKAKTFKEAIKNMLFSYPKIKVFIR